MSGVASQLLNAAQANAILGLVQKHLNIVLTSTSRIRPGESITASLIPLTPVIDASELVNGVLNIALASKDVLFGNPNAINLPNVTAVNSGEGVDGDSLVTALGGITGRKPFPPPLTGLLADTTGIVTQLFGSLTPPSLKISVEIKWKVTDQDCRVLTEQEGHLVAPNGLTSPNLSLNIVPPIFREYRLDTLQDLGGSIVCLSAEITLKLEDHRLTFPTPRIPILLLPMLIPTVVALFNQPNFDLTHDSSVVLLVPEHSPFSSAESLFNVLKNIESAMSTLRSVGGLAGFFLGLDDALGSIPEQPRFRLVTARPDEHHTPAEGEGIPALDEIVVKRKPWYSVLGEHDHFDDSAHSLLVLGPPGTKVQFFNNEFYNTDQGSFTVELGGNDFFVAIRNLNVSSDRAPVTFPKDKANTFDANSGSRWRHMSSVLFKSDWIDAMALDAKNPLPIPSFICDCKEPGREEPVQPPPVNQDMIDRPVKPAKKKKSAPKKRDDSKKKKNK